MILDTIFPLLESESFGAYAVSLGPEDSVLESHRRAHSGAALPAPGETSALSRRDLEVLSLVALDWETTRIADELAISRHTVRNHIRNLRNKLNASNKLDAVVKGLRLGIISVEGSPQ